MAGWDAVEGEQATKGRERRTVPIIGECGDPRRAQAPHRAPRPRPDVRGVGGLAVPPEGATGRADAAWKAAGLERITLHECRHTFASIAIAAGVNIGTVSAALGTPR